MKNEFAEDLFQIAPQWFIEKWAGDSKIYIPYSLIRRRKFEETIQKFEHGAERRQLLREANISDWAFRRELQRRRKK